MLFRSVFMRATFDSLRSSLVRWHAGRKVVLGSILVAGALATSAELVQRFATHDCDTVHHVARAYTYSGIGVVIEQGEEGDAIVRRVLPDAPAQGKLHVGARLVSVNGESPRSIEGWAAAIRGKAGTDVELEVAYPCSGHKNVTLERNIVRVAY